jgi:predicted ATPase
MPNLIESIRPAGILSFPPEIDPIELLPLNVMIGPNGSGKSNFIEVLELLRSAPADLAGAIRDGGGVGEWLWKGSKLSGAARLESKIRIPGLKTPLRYLLELGLTGQRLEVLDEAIEDAQKTKAGADDVRFYYRFQRGHPVINMKAPAGVPRSLSRESLDPQQSVLSQRKDPDLYPEVTSLGKELGRIATFREWNFGRNPPVRQPQPVDLPGDVLLGDARNLALFLNGIEHSDSWNRLKEILRRFLPRFDQLSTRLNGPTVQLYLHEQGLSAPVPATRLSDGTVRFIALIAVLLKPDFASLICIEEPELGMHPDALSIIAELMIEASKKTQIVVTTHSDVLLSELSESPEAVLVFENLRGSTSIRRLDRDKLNFWLRESSLGEVWRAGELGGNP